LAIRRVLKDLFAYGSPAIFGHVHLLIYKKLCNDLRLALEHDFLLDLEFEALRRNNSVHQTSKFSQSLGAGKSYVIYESRVGKAVLGSQGVKSSIYVPKSEVCQRGAGLRSLRKLEVKGGQPYEDARGLTCYSQVVKHAQNLLGADTGKAILYIRSQNYLLADVWRRIGQDGPPSYAAVGTRV